MVAQGGGVTSLEMQPLVNWPCLTHAHARDYLNSVGLSVTLSHPPTHTMKVGEA